MDSFEHLPGCDRRHTRRQRCSTWEPAPSDAEATDGGLPSYTPAPSSVRPGAPSATTVTRVALVVVLAPFAPVAGLLAVAGLVSAALFFKDPFGYVDAFRGAPTLPAWAYPDGELTDTGPCDGNGYHPHCRQLIFGSTSQMSHLIAELRPKFEDRGWNLHVGVTGEYFVADAPSREVCIYYSAIYQREVEQNARRYLGVVDGTKLASGFWGDFDTRVTVEVSDCSGG